MPFRRHYDLEELVHELVGRFEVSEVYAVGAVENFSDALNSGILPSENLGKCMPDVAYYIWETLEFWEVPS